MPTRWPSHPRLMQHTSASFKYFYLQVQGGGNAANALTAAARLGLGSTLVTKVRYSGCRSFASACLLHSCMHIREGLMEGGLTSGAVFRVA